MTHTDFISSLMHSVRTVGTGAHSKRHAATVQRSPRACTTTRPPRSTSRPSVDSSRPMSATWPSAGTR